MPGHEQDRTSGDSGTPAVEEAEIVKEGGPDIAPPRPGKAAAGTIRQASSEADGPFKKTAGFIRTGRTWMFTRPDSLPSMAFKGLVFGIIAAIASGIAVVIWQGWYQQTETVAPIDGDMIESRLAALEEQIPALASRATDSEASIVSLQSFAVDLEAVRSLFAEAGPGEAGSVLRQIDDLQARHNDLGERFGIIAGNQAQLQTASTRQQAEQENIAGQINALGLELDLIRQSLQGISDTGRTVSDQDQVAASDAINRQHIDRLGEQINAIAVTLDRTTREHGEILPRLTKLEQDIAFTIAAQMTLATDIITIQDHLAVLSEQVPDNQQTVGIVLFNLGVAVRTGSPYLTLLEDSGIADRDLPPALAEHAASGIPTMDELLVELDALSRLAVRQNQAAGATGFVGEIGQFFKSLVAIRPLTPMEGDTTRAILSRARFALERGAIDEALVIMDELQPEAAAVMADWIASASARTSVMRALRELNRSSAPPENRTDGETEPTPS
ncbi:MAG: hypothetical protein OXC91_01475 [Rhodobacteraceae bacterium]|nr:hypothetical protein [Paracoccaceae bacterium]